MPGAVLTFRSHGPTDVHAPDVSSGTLSFSSLSPLEGSDPRCAAEGLGVSGPLSCSVLAGCRPILIVAGGPFAPACFVHTSAVRVPDVLTGRSLSFRATTFGRPAAHLLHSPARSRTPSRSSPCSVIRSPPARWQRGGSSRRFLDRDLLSFRSQSHSTAPPSSERYD